MLGVLCTRPQSLQGFVKPRHTCAIFIDMFTPKWARGPHNLARFPSWDPCITPGY